MENEKDDGGPAFPIPIAAQSSGGIYNTLQQSSGKLGGMSLRDWFAGMALQGLCSNEKFMRDQLNEWLRMENGSPDLLRASHVSTCYQFADAMIAERAKK